ncbi:MAG: hypothetical protein D6681_14435 [Calditrichaeota bacterium]|nr:MAG: hypothetical protein D6681_14435 [Calditrichota bacterium]
MIVRDPKEFVNNDGVRFILPFDNLEEDDGPYEIIELRTKVVILFFVSSDHFARTRNIICFDRATGEVLWLIEESHGRWLPENNRNMYLEESWEYAIHYAMMKLFCRDDDGGHAWIEEYYNWRSEPWNEYRHPWIDPVAAGRVARHPKYRESEGRYRIVDSKGYWVRSDTHELEPRDMELESTMPQPWERGYRSMEERGYCGVVYYTDATGCAEEDCLLVAFSGEFYFEVDLNTGKVTPAYADIAEKK